ncbi:MAG: LuxR C-terminal-related transcriptional regulator [Bacillota bacterium]
MEPIRLLVLDPLPIVARGIASLFSSEPDLTVVGSASSLGKGLELAAEHAPDIVMTELHLVDGHAVDLIQALRERRARCKAVVLTCSCEQADVLRMLRAGADGYLLKAVEPQRIVKDLRLIAAGEPVVAGAAAMMALQRVAELKAEALPITPREAEVLALLATGLSNRDMARRLDLTEHTVKRHVHAILEKLGLSNRAEAAAFAVAHGLADGPAARVDWRHRELVV